MLSRNMSVVAGTTNKIGRLCLVCSGPNLINSFCFWFDSI